MCGKGAGRNLGPFFFFVLTPPFVSDMAYVSKQTEGLKKMKKELKDMTDDERIEYWTKLREQERKQRQTAFNKLTDEQKLVVHQLYKQLDDILDIALYPDNGGIKYVSAYDLQELEGTTSRFAHQFNLRQ